MSGWVRGIYNAAASFVLSRSLRAASGSSMGRNAKHMREVSDQPNEHKQSCESCKSDKHACPCTGTACSCTGATPGTPTGRDACSSAAERASSYCTYCRGGSSEDGSKAGAEDGYIRTYVDPDFGVSPANTDAKCSEGERTSTGVRDSYESRDFKHSNANTTDPVERCTGIPTGVTI